MLQQTSVQRIKGGNATTGLPSSRLVTCSRGLNITFKSQCKDKWTANLKTNCGKKTVKQTWNKLNTVKYKKKGKGKAFPLQAWSGPEGSRKLRFPDFMITAQDGGKVVSLTHWPPLPPGNTPGTHFC